MLAWGTAVSTEQYRQTILVMGLVMGPRFKEAGEARNLRWRIDIPTKLRTMRMHSCTVLHTSTISLRSTGHLQFGKPAAQPFGAILPSGLQAPALQHMHSAARAGQTRSTAITFRPADEPSNPAANDHVSPPQGLEPWTTPEVTTVHRP